jgi:hypothetical protein
VSERLWGRGLGKGGEDMLMGVVLRLEMVI